MNNAVVYDCVVLGAGPAGLTAGLYLGRYGYNVAICERNAIGGNLVQIEELKNYPGHKGSGKMLAKTLREQVKEVGVPIKYGECMRLSWDEGIYTLEMDDEDELRTRTIIIATGKTPRRINLPEGIEKPVSTCATCDGPLYKGKRVVVLGGGNSAVSEAITLAKLMKGVEVVSRSLLRADAELIERLSEIENVRIYENVKFDESNAKYLQILNNADVVFMFLGAEPAVGFLGGAESGVAFDNDGYILTEADNMAKPGIFVAGDVRKGAINQVINAAADGVIAAMGVKKHLESSKI